MLGLYKALAQVTCLIVFFEHYWTLQRHLYCLVLPQTHPSPECSAEKCPKADTIPPWEPYTPSILMEGNTAWGGQALAYGHCFGVGKSPTTRGMQGNPSVLYFHYISSQALLRGRSLLLEPKEPVQVVM